MLLEGIDVGARANVEAMGATQAAPRMAHGAPRSSPILAGFFLLRPPCPRRQHDPGLMSGRVGARCNCSPDWVDGIVPHVCAGG